MDFASRHIGPAPAEQEHMLGTLGYASLDELTTAALPPGLRRRQHAGRPAARGDGGRGAAPAPGPGGPEPGADLHDRPRLLRHRDPGRHPPQRAGEPRLVHLLHAVPAGDLPGAAGGAAELPDDGRGPDRPGGGRRLAARRGHRGRRGDDAGPPGRAHRQHLPGRRPVPAADSRGAGHPGRAAGHRPGGRRGDRTRGGGPARRGTVRRAAALPGRHRGDPRPAPGDRRRQGAGRASPRSRPTCWPSPCSCRRANWAPTSRWAAPSGSASRWATAARTPRTSRSATAWRASCPGGWSGCRWTPPGSPPTGSRCRPGSSTSAGRRRRATSAPRRYCSRSSPGCTRSTTGRTGWRPSPAACTAGPPCSPPRSAPRAAPSRMTRSSTRSRCAASPAAPRPAWPGPATWATTSTWPDRTPCRPPATRRPPSSTCATWSPRWPAPIPPT